MAIIGLAGREVSALAREIGSACLAVVDGREIGGPTPDSRKSDKWKFSAKASETAAQATWCTGRLLVRERITRRMQPPESQLKTAVPNTFFAAAD